MSALSVQAGEEATYLDGEAGVRGGVADVACADDVNTEADDVAVQRDNNGEWCAFRSAYAVLKCQ